MADGGVPTTELGEVAGAEAVLANYEGTTGLLSTSALGTVLAAGGVLAAASTTDALSAFMTCISHMSVLMAPRRSAPSRTRGERQVLAHARAPSRTPPTSRSRQSFVEVWAFPPR